MGRVITLVTDFGLKDPFVGQMKGVIKGINPEVEIIDITHDISPHSIKEAAIVVGLSYEYFPPRSIHLVVVDPGVGSERRPILVTTERHYFIGPDNGVFSMVYQKERDTFQVRHITAEHYFLKKESPTFQGRDLFAPVAAWLSKGIPTMNFGEVISDFVRIPIPEPTRPAPSAIEGEVIHIDRFGNALTNITEEMLRPYIKEGRLYKIVFKGREVPLRRYYAEADDKGLYSVFDSFGLLELYVYRDNASKIFDIKVGDIVGVLIK